MTDGPAHASPDAVNLIWRAASLAIARSSDLGPAFDPPDDLADAGALTEAVEAMIADVSGDEPGTVGARLRELEALAARARAGDAEGAALAADLDRAASLLAARAGARLARRMRQMEEAPRKRALSLRPFTRTGDGGAR